MLNTTYAVAVQLGQAMADVVTFGVPQQRAISQVTPTDDHLSLARGAYTRAPYLTPGAQSSYEVRLFGAMYGKHRQ